MRYHEYGKQNTKTAVLIHGACMSWQMLDGLAVQLADEFHVVSVAVSGMDPEGGEPFLSLPLHAKQIEDWLIWNGYRDVELLYGLSMGGGFVLRMLADNRLNVRYAVIDAGIAPYELPYLQTRLILLADWSVNMLAKKFPSLLKYAFPPRRYKDGAERIAAVMRNMSSTTIRNVYDSTDNYPMPDVFPETGTVITYWYGEDEKKARKPDLAYIRKHIGHALIEEIPGMDHGEFVTVHPEEAAEKIRKMMKEEILGG